MASRSSSRYVGKTHQGERNPVKSIGSIIFVSLVMLQTVGCGQAGPTVYPVQGTVTIGGKPAPSIAVTFAPVDGKPASAGKTNANGVFILLTQSGKAGAVAGKHKVILQSQPAVESTGNFSDPAVREKMFQEREASARSGKKGAPPTEKSKTIPEEYSNPQKTPLEYEVKAGTNNFDVPIP